MMVYKGMLDQTIGQNNIATQAPTLLILKVGKPADHHQMQTYPTLTSSDQCLDFSGADSEDGFLLNSFKGAG